EEAQLPAIERLAELGVLVGDGEPLAQVAGEAASEAVEPCGLAVRLRSGDREHRPDAVRPPVQALEQNRAGRDRTRGRQSERGERIRKLCRRVGRVEAARRKVVLELEDAQSIRLPAESRRPQS